MLVLTRKTGEEIFIDNGQIQIKIICIHNGIVAIGINAPSQIDIDRKEIFLSKRLNPQEKVSVIAHQIEDLSL